MLVSGRLNPGLYPPRHELLPSYDRPPPKQGDILGTIPTSGGLGLSVETHVHPQGPQNSIVRGDSGEK